MADANIRAVISAKDDASKVLKGFGDNASSIGNKIGQIAKVAGVALLATATAAVAFGVSSVKAFEESEAAIAQTNAVLKSTGGIAGVTAAEVDRLSKSLQKQTKFSDEDVRSVENLLLTFTAITKDIFPDATATVLDMATALGEDTKSAAIQLGKALQDPVLGITALRRVGVNFSDAQKDVIKRLVETGQKAKAQQLILKELHTEFGGSAIAAGNTFAGSLAKLKNSFNDLQESIGSAIVHAITPFVQKIAELVARIDIEKVIRNVTTAFRLLWDTISGGDPTIKLGEERFIRLSIALQDVRDKVMKVYTAVATYLWPKLIALWNSIDTKLIPTLLKLWHQVLEPLMPLIGKAAVVEIGLMIDYINAWITVSSKVINVITSIPEAVRTAFRFIRVEYHRLRDDVSETFTQIKTIMRNAVDTSVDFIVGKLHWLRDNWLELVGEVIGFVATWPIKLPILVTLALIGMIKAIISIKWSDVFAGIWQGMQAVWDHVTAIAVHAWQTIHDLAWSSIPNGIWQGFQFAWDKITQLAVVAWQRIHDLPWGALFTGIGKSFANGLIDLIEGALKGALKGLPGHIEDKIHLPRFDKGGVVPGAIGAPTLAVVHGGERVIPNSGGRPAGGTVNISVNVGVFAGTQMEFRKLASKLQSAYQDAQSMGTA